MRTDYDKLICERPRRGHTKKYHDVRAKARRGDLEDLPRTESMRRVHAEYDWSKEFSDNLSPLRRWMEKQVNRPYDKVMSDLHSVFGVRRTTDVHIWQHVKWFVELRTHMVNGRLHGDTGGKPFPVFAGDLYVDQHGILKKMPHKAKQRSAPRVQIPYSTEPYYQYENHNDIWYIAEYHWKKTDLVLSYWTLPTNAIAVSHKEQAALCFHSKQALSSKEIKKLRKEGILPSND